MINGIRSFAGDARSLCLFVRNIQKRTVKNKPFYAGEESPNFSFQVGIKIRFFSCEISQTMDRSTFFLPLFVLFVRKKLILEWK